MNSSIKFLKVNILPIRSLAFKGIVREKLKGLSSKIKSDSMVTHFTSICCF